MFSQEAPVFVPRRMEDEQQSAGQSSMSFMGIPMSHVTQEDTKKQTETTSNWFDGIPECTDNIGHTFPGGIPRNNNAPGGFKDSRPGDHAMPQFPDRPKPQSKYLHMMNQGKPQGHQIHGQDLPIYEWGCYSAPHQYRNQFPKDNQLSSYAASSSHSDGISPTIDYQNYGIPPAMPAPFLTGNEAYTPIGNNPTNYSQSDTQRRAYSQMLQNATSSGDSNVRKETNHGITIPATDAQVQHLGNLRMKIRASLAREGEHEYDQLSSMRRKFIAIFMAQAMNAEDLIARINWVYQVGILD